MSRRVYQIPTPKNPFFRIETVQPWHLYPQQTRPTLVPPRQQPPSTWTPILGVPFVPPTQSSIFPVTQPSRRPSYFVRTKVRAGSGALPSVSAKMPFTYPVSQPDRRTFWTEPVRYRRDVVPHVYYQTVTPPATPFDVIQPTQLHKSAWIRWQQIATTLPILGPPAAAVQADIFRVQPDPPLWYQRRPAPRLIARVIRGTSLNTLSPPGLPDQPTRRWWVARDVWTTHTRNPIFRIETVDATFLVGSHTQPSRQWYGRPPLRLRLVSLRSNTTIPQATFLFPLDQPIAARYPGRLVVPVVFRGLDDVTTARPQSDTWQGHVRPPLYAVRYDVNRFPRLGPAPPLDTIVVAAAPQLYTFNTLQPNPADWRAGWRPWQWPAFETWLTSFGPPPQTIAATFVTWNQEGLLCVTWELTDGTYVTWNQEGTTFQTWPGV